MKKVKKIPQRKCIVCQDRDSKKELIRIVKNKEGEIFLDPSGRANGRGAYICKDSECLKKAIKTKALNRAFKVEVSDEVYENTIFFPSGHVILETLFSPFVFVLYVMLKFLPEPSVIFVTLPSV